MKKSKNVAPIGGSTSEVDQVADAYKLIRSSVIEGVEEPYSRVETISHGGAAMNIEVDARPKKLGRGLGTVSLRSFFEGNGFSPKPIDQIEVTLLKNDSLLFTHTDAYRAVSRWRVDQNASIKELGRGQESQVDPLASTLAAADIIEGSHKEDKETSRTNLRVAA